MISGVLCRLQLSAKAQNMPVSSLDFTWEAQSLSHSFQQLVLRSAELNQAKYEPPL